MEKEGGGCSGGGRGGLCKSENKRLSVLAVAERETPCFKIRGCWGGGGGYGGVGGVGVGSSGGGGSEAGSGNLCRGSGDLSSCYVGENFTVRSGGTSYQLFDVLPHKSPAMAAGVGFPFTFSQWKELERQTTIYKYMVCSLPVPADLLHPLPRNIVSPDVCASSLHTRNKDLEPGSAREPTGRNGGARETWRRIRNTASAISTEAAPVQESLWKSKPALIAATRRRELIRLELSLLLQATITSPVLRSPLRLISLFLLIRGLTGGLKFESILEDDTVEPPWRQFIQEGYANLFNSEQQQPLQIASYSSFPAREIEIGAPPRLRDVLSTDNLSSGGGIVNPENLSTSLKLSIAMAVGDSLDQELMKIPLMANDEIRSKNSGWLRPVPWELLLEGGPLAEALHLGPAAGSPPDSISTAATTVSSPSGVLPRTMFSHSDGSVCNSPTFGVEAAFHRLN